VLENKNAGVHVERRELFSHLFEHSGLPEPDEENKQKAVYALFFALKFKSLCQKTLKQ
jgi:hypothetical protein